MSCRTSGGFQINLDGKTAVVTRGGNGIGRALSHRFVAEGATVVVSDLDGTSAATVADKIGGTAVQADVGREAGIVKLVETTRNRHGAIDLFCGNAGVFVEGGVEVPDEDWDEILRVNTMQLVWAARHVVPTMIERGSGGFLITASAAGLLTQISSAPYSFTKHAAVSFAEWLAVTYGDQGLEVYCLCPQAVRTAMLREFEAKTSLGDFFARIAIDPEEVAEAVVQAMAEQRFLVLPHPEVAEYDQRRAENRDRWLKGMQGFRASLKT